MRHLYRGKNGRDCERNDAGHAERVAEAVQAVLDDDDLAPNILGSVEGVQVVPVIPVLEDLLTSHRGPEMRDRLRVRLDLGVHEGKLERGGRAGSNE